MQQRLQNWIQVSFRSKFPIKVVFLVSLSHTLTHTHNGCWCSFPSFFKTKTTVSFSWGANSPAQPSWEECFKKLSSIYNKIGNCDVFFNQKNPTHLAQWSSNQRNEYKRFMKRRDTIISLDQIEKLNSIEFNWKGPRLLWFLV